MKITCDIIRDLIPLYTEDLASQDSRTLVEEHLRCCNACAIELSNLRKAQFLPVEKTVDSLKYVKNQIILKRSLSVTVSVCILLTLASFIFTYLFAPFQLTKEQALDDFYVREDGAIVIDYSPYVTGRSQSGLNDNWFINQYSTRYDMWRGDNRKSIQELFGSDGVITPEEHQRYENIDIIYGNAHSTDDEIQPNGQLPIGTDNINWESEKNWWYSDPSGMGNDILLHDAGKEVPAKEDRIQYAPIYPMLFFAGIVLSIVLMGLWRFTKKHRMKEIACNLLIIFGSIVFSTLYVSSGRIFTSYVGVIDQYWGWMIGINTVFLALTLLLGRKLYLLNRKDQGI